MLGILPVADDRWGYLHAFSMGLSPARDWVPGHSLCTSPPAAKSHAADLAGGPVDVAFFAIQTYLDERRRQNHIQGSRVARAHRTLLSLCVAATANASLVVLSAVSYNLESIDVRNLLSNYDLKDYIFLIIKPSGKKLDIFLKGRISGNNIIKNFSILRNNENESIYKNAIDELKIEINELWKANNLIDVRTPSFLNVTLDINQRDDLLKIQKVLNKIDLIDNYYVFELDKDQVKIKIKYLGKIDKIKSKLDENNIKLIINKNKWKLKLI